MTSQDALDWLSGHANPQKAAEMAAYHKVDRLYLGVTNPVLDDQARTLRQNLTLGDRLTLADGLWTSNTHEARIMAAKLLTQARIKPDDARAWDMIAGWVPDFDAWAIADHACMAGHRRLLADPSRVDQVEPLDAERSHVETSRRAGDHPTMDQAKPPQRVRPCHPGPRFGLGGALRARP